MIYLWYNKKSIMNFDFLIVNIFMSAGILTAILTRESTFSSYLKTYIAIFSVLHRRDAPSHFVGDANHLEQHYFLQSKRQAYPFDH